VIVQDNDMTTDNGVDDLDEMFHNDGTDSPVWDFVGHVGFYTHRNHHSRDSEVVLVESQWDNR
jgi:hypothetical protein